MPLAPARACPCGGRILSGACDRCGPKRRQDTRGPREQHRRNVTYGRKWKEFRLRFLAEHPLCEDCQEADKITAASEVHHLAKVTDRPDLRLEWTNLLALCKRCHSVRTAKGE